MRYPQKRSLFQYLSLFLNLTLLLHTLPTSATPITPSLPSPYQDPSNPSAISHLNPNSNSINPALPPTLIPRGPTVHYRNLGVWRMVLTLATWFIPPPDKIISPAATALAQLFDQVAKEATANIATKVPEVAYLEWTFGAIHFAYRVRYGNGQSGATVPWDLVARLATVFEQRALKGDPSAFRAVVDGPLPVVGGVQTWIEVVCTVKGKVDTVVPGFPWSLY